MFKKAFIKKIAHTECVSPQFLERQLAAGRAVICINNTHRLERPCAIGDGFKVKINTNIGTSPRAASLTDELEKLRVAVAAGTDAVMDLSTGGDLPGIRRAIVSNSPVPIGTVPVYEAAARAHQRHKPFDKLSFSEFMDVLETQARDGVDFFTIHAGLIQETIKKIQAKRRAAGIVSRGGALLARWMIVNKKENPFYEHFDDVLKLCKSYAITLSLGDALRPGAIADSSDYAQLAELRVLGHLVTRCRKAGVQVMVEGPGHIRLDQIAWNMKIEKKWCHGAPFYTLGPIPLDIAPGYDHISSAIGGALGALAGSNFLCVVTPAEHLRHPDADDIHQGVMASRIAAHAVNLLRFKDERARDDRMAYYRAHRDWKNQFKEAMDPIKARRYKGNAGSAGSECTMCGNFCSMKIADACHLVK